MTNGGWDMSNIDSLDRDYLDMVGANAYNNKNVTIKNITRDFSDKFDKLQLCFISDTHIGSSDFDIKGLIENLKYADSQENALVFFLGDGMNTAIIGAKSDPYEDIMKPQQQLSFYSKILALAKGNQKLTDVLNNLNSAGKIVVVHSGNHEDRITRAVGVSTTKMAADIAGVGEAYAPFYASTTLLLRQPKAQDGKFPINIITHHGTGVRNSDGIFRLIRNVNNVDLAVIGHTHQHSISLDRTIKVDEDGEQYYHDIMYVTLPASGGGTYGAGMALPDVAKQSAVWVEVSSQPNSEADRISPTGIRHRKIIPAFAFFPPNIRLTTNIQNKRKEQARRVINGSKAGDKGVYSSVDELLAKVAETEKKKYAKVADRIAEVAEEAPAGFEEYVKSKMAKRTVSESGGGKPSETTDGMDIIGD